MFHSDSAYVCYMYYKHQGFSNFLCSNSTNKLWILVRTNWEIIHLKQFYLCDFKYKYYIELFIKSIFSMYVWAFYWLKTAGVHCTYIHISLILYNIYNIHHTFFITQENLYFFKSLDTSNLGAIQILENSNVYVDTFNFDYL